MRISDWSSYVCSSDPDRAPGSVRFASGGDGVRQHQDRSGDRCRQLAFVLRLATALLVEPAFADTQFGKSEERRVGQGCVSTCRSWLSPYNSTNKRLNTTRYNTLSVRQTSTIHN